MSKLVYLRGLSTDLNNTSLKDGQILFTTDTNELYVDFIHPETNEVVRESITDKILSQELQTHIESLNKVENKSSEEIRDEITYENVINALGYVPSIGESVTLNAEGIVYDNTESGLKGQNVQSALDELVEKNAVNQINILTLQESTKNVVEGNENEIDKIWKTDENGVPGWREAASDEVTVDREIYTPIFPTEWNILEGSNESPVLNCRSFCYGQGKIITNTGYYSIDNGITWNIISDLFNNIIYEIIYANNRFVCIGKDGVSFYSLDGVLWNEMTGLDAAVDLDDYYAYDNLIYGKDKFMCACVGESSGVIYYSTNGTTWNKKIFNESEDPVSVLGYGKDKFICFFGENQPYYSTDGITWTKGNKIAPDDWYCTAIGYGNNQFIAVFCQYIYDEVTLYYSNDGITWTTNENLSLDNEPWRGTLQFDNINYYTDRYIANSGSTICYSLDGVSWFTMPGINEDENNFENNINNVIFNEQEKTLIAIGEDYIYYLIDEREEITYEQETLKVSELALELYNNRTPLYDTTGDNTDGAMTQAAVTALVGDIGSILDEINRTEV